MRAALAQAAALSDQIPARVGPALWAHARLTDTPAAQYAAWGKAPDQYPHAERW